MAIDVLLQISGLLDELERADVDVAALPDELRAMHHLKARFDAQVARRVGAFDRSREWAAEQAGSCAGWLRRQCRLSKDEARATVRRAKHIGSMPWVAECWSAGAINTSHVDVITTARNAAHADEEFAAYEAQFVNIALHGAPEDVSGVARQWRDALDAHRQPDQTLVVQQYESRNLHLSPTIDDRWVVHGLLDPEAGSYVERAIRHKYDEQHHAGDDRTPAQQRADALVGVCRDYLAGLPDGSNVPHVTVVTDADTVCGDAIGLCETDQGLRLSPATMDRMRCDARISIAILTADGVVLQMGRSTRTFTPGQARALRTMYPTCVLPGCTVASSKCDMHHAHTWEDGGDTDVGNGAPVCSHDHHLFHEYRWSIVRDPVTGQVDIYQPDGTHVGTTYPRRRPEPIAITRDREPAAL